MNQNELTDQDKMALSRCLTDGVEPPAELAKKLFPSVCGTWDVAKLNRASIPTIEYSGKRSEAMSCEVLERSRNLPPDLSCDLSAIAP